MKLSSPRQEKQKKEKQKHPKTISSILSKTNFVLYFGMPADKSIKKKILISQGDCQLSIEDFLHSRKTAD